REKIHSPFGQLTEHVHGYCSCPRYLLVSDLFADCGVDTFDVKIRNPLVVFAEELHSVTSTIGMVAGVEAEGDLFRVGLLKKGLNLLLIFNMCFGVRMEDHLKPKAALGKVSHFMRSVDESPPCIGIKTRWTYRPSGDLACVGAVD